MGVGKTVFPSSAADASAALSAVCVFSPCTFPATATVCSFVFPGNGNAKISGYKQRMAVNPCGVYR